MREMLSPLDGIRSPFGPRRGGFSPAFLFTASEPGVWFDPSDFSTMFQDSLGLTPVTAQGQTVGLMLDKSKGLALGAENGAQAVSSVTFDTGDAVRGIVEAYNGGNVVAGKTYKIVYSFECTVAPVTNNEFEYRIGAGTPVVMNTITGLGVVSGTYYMTAAASGAFILRFDEVVADRGGAYANISISVKEIAGNHATQATAASRPILIRRPKTGRRNQLTYTEQPDNAAWSKNFTSVVADSTTAPNGQTTADTIRLTAGVALTTPAAGLFTSAVPYASIASATLAAGAHVAFVDVKAAAGISHVQLRTSINSSLNPSIQAAVVRLSDGVIIDDPSGLATSTALGDGWYRIALPFTATAAIHYAGIWFWNSASIASAAGTEGVYFGGIQMEPGSAATAYQKVTSTYDVTEAGVPDVYALLADGVDDGMVTSTITPGTDKVQVFAGVRKSSDANPAMLAEWSTTFGNPNTFAVRAPRSGASPSYDFNTRGSGSSGNAIANGLAAPITSVVTCIGDIAADTSIIRVNGVEQGSAITDQGTGNYDAHPLYLFRRGGASLPFNGHCYGMIVRFGANLTADQIAAVEAWMNGKTGAY
jgi:hypothetical protein